jgi:hypothetical protein
MPAPEARGHVIATAMTLDELAEAIDSAREE